MACTFRTVADRLRAQRAPGAGGAAVAEPATALCVRRARYLVIDDFLSPAEHARPASPCDGIGGTLRDRHRRRRWRRVPAEPRDSRLRRLGACAPAAESACSSGIRCWPGPWPVRSSRCAGGVAAHGGAQPAVLQGARRRGADAPRELSCIYYVHRQPRGFAGGELRLYDCLESDGERRAAATPSRASSRISNRMVAFRSDEFHEAMPVRCPSGEFADSRFAVTTWLHRAAKPDPDARFGWGHFRCGGSHHSSVFAARRRRRLVIYTVLCTPRRCGAVAVRAARVLVGAAPGSRGSWSAWPPSRRQQPLPRHRLARVVGTLVLVAASVHRGLLSGLQHRRVAARVAVHGAHRRDDPAGPAGLRVPRCRCRPRSGRGKRGRPPGAIFLHRQRPLRGLRARARLAFLERFCVDRNLASRPSPAAANPRHDLRRMAARWLELMSIIREETAAGGQSRLDDALPTSPMRSPPPRPDRARRPTDLGVDTDAGPGQPPSAPLPVSLSTRPRGEIVWDAAPTAVDKRSRPERADSGSGREFLALLEEYCARRAAGGDHAMLRPRRRPGSASAASSTARCSRSPVAPIRSP